MRTWFTRRSRNLGIAPDEEFSISDKQARELLSKITAGDVERPFLTLVAAYGRLKRGIFAAHIKDAWEIEEAENGFGAEVVQKAGQYAGKMPVDHWLAKMAKNQGIDVYWRRKRRRQFVAYQVEIAVKMRDDGEKDDLDWESLADKDAVAEERERTPDEVLEQEELAKEAHQVVTSFLDFVDEETAEAVVQNKVEGIPVEAWAKRTGKAGESTLKMQLSRVYQKMRKESSACFAAGSRPWGYQGGDWE